MCDGTGLRWSNVGWRLQELVQAARRRELPANLTFPEPPTGPVVARLAGSGRQLRHGIQRQFVWALSQYTCKARGLPR